MLFIPSHLRILYVSAETVMLNMSVWQNLVFGNAKLNNPARIEKILLRLKAVEILELCHDDLLARKQEMGCDDKSAVTGTQEEDGDEQKTCATNPLEKMRASQKATLHLARALIMNPEVMVLHRPFMHYPKAGNDKSAELVMEILSEHVRNRGFEMDPATKSSRRPRSVFFTPDSPEQAQMADVCWELPADCGGPCRAEPPDIAWPVETHAKYAAGGPVTGPPPSAIPPLDLISPHSAQAMLKQEMLAVGLSPRIWEASNIADRRPPHGFQTHQPGNAGCSEEGEGG